MPGYTRCADKALRAVPWGERPQKRGRFTAASKGSLALSSWWCRKPSCTGCPLYEANVKAGSFGWPEPLRNWRKLGSGAGLAIRFATSRISFDVGALPAGAEIGRPLSSIAGALDHLTGVGKPWWGRAAALARQTAETLVRAEDRSSPLAPAQADGWGRRALPRTPDQDALV